MNQIFRNLLRPLAHRSVTSHQRIFCILNSHDNPSDAWKSLLVTPPTNNTAEFWSNVKQTILATNRNAKKANVDGIILNHLCANKNIETAKLFVESMQKNGEKLNPLIKGIMLKLYYHATHHKDYVLTEDDKSRIIEIYRELKQNYDTFDSTTCENLILGLSLTSAWKEGIQLLEDAKLTAIPGRFTYTALITSALKNEEPSTFFRLLDEMIGHEQQPTSQIYNTWIDWCKNMADFEKIFRFLEDMGLHMPLDSAEKLIKKMSSMKITAQKVRVTKYGNCSGCKKSLDTTALTIDEFNNVRDAFLSKVIVKNNIFLNTNPEELQAFKNFLEENGPYDCVVDGLNVAYSKGNKGAVAQANLLLQVVTELTKIHKNILVLGKKHMIKWPAQQMKRLRMIADTFFTADISQDDPFLLYATLKSGPEARFCSRDLMRQHAFLLGPELRICFFKWRDQRQYKLKSSFKVLFDKPCLYKGTAHKIDNVWHIPFVEDERTWLNEYVPTDEKQWMCIQLKNSNKKII
ncbi:mitochondrial ribonuclease P catalytic subunit [Culicoides brevitarsis]|uniref:mitochondrial ribonuclease P catalytic subunit n=1 Tax=Culicoides brevitarsis TaxID=469753 RepID=UPI00307B5522